jgi:hypothetical protein
VITGVVKDSPTPPDVEQDYVVAGLQPWIDGVMTDSGVVRQVCISASLVVKLMALCRSLWRCPMEKITLSKNK